ncbi:Cell wall galactomannoprotein [Moelleriella libera RCEF 2490]|uniref:Cell wall galactomannoprotein n=1 Tax=Moelleriella libera RCEF 2490 TaxID=1081109 RepID=A0A166V5G4_9HYPO|nr:Cell wall galactomannoprotein [Moelleriella libera RCEF 2490]
MKLATPLAILAAVSGAQCLVIERSTRLVEVINNVLDRTTKLDAAATAFNGVDIKPITDAADDLIDTIYNGQDIAFESGDIGLYDAIPLFQPITKLENEAQKLFNTFKDRKNEVQNVRQCGTAREKLGIISESSNTLIGIVQDKIKDKTVKDVAKGRTDHIKKLLLEARDIYSEENCRDSS